MAQISPPPAATALTAWGVVLAATTPGSSTVPGSETSGPDDAGDVPGEAGREDAGGGEGSLVDAGTTPAGVLPAVVGDAGDGVTDASQPLIRTNAMQRAASRRTTTPAINIPRHALPLRAGSVRQV